MANNVINFDIKVQNKEIENYLQNVTESTYGLIENLVGKTSKNSRGGAKKIEEGRAGLRISGENSYWRNWKSKTPWEHVTNAYWDSKTKSFKTKNRKAKGGVKDYGLENFKFFERPGKGSINGTRASARLTSNIANLHEYDVHFPKGSLHFYDNKTKKTASYGRGEKRYGRHFFNEYKVLAIQTMGKSQDEALTKWQEAIKRGTTS